VGQRRGINTRAFARQEQRFLEGRQGPVQVGEGGVQVPLLAVNARALALELPGDRRVQVPDQRQCPTEVLGRRAVLTPLGVGSLRASN